MRACTKRRQNQILFVFFHFSSLESRSEFLFRPVKIPSTPDLCDQQCIEDRNVSSYGKSEFITLISSYKNRPFSVAWLDADSQKLHRTFAAATAAVSSRNFPWSGRRSMPASFACAQHCAVAWIIYIFLHFLLSRFVAPAFPTKIEAKLKRKFYIRVYFFFY